MPKIFFYSGGLPYICLLNNNSMKTSLILLALAFFGLAGLTLTGTLQELIPFQGVANEIATFMATLVAGTLCLGAAVMPGHTEPFAPAPPKSANLNVPFGSHHRDIEVDADEWEERQEILKELAGK